MTPTVEFRNVGMTRVNWCLLFCSLGLLPFGGVMVRLWRVERDMDPVLPVAILFLAGGVAGTVWAVCLLCDRSLRLTLTPEGIIDHRRKGRLIRWGEIRKVRYKVVSDGEGPSLTELELDVETDGGRKRRVLNLSDLTSPPEAVAALIRGRVGPSWLDRTG